MATANELMKKAASQAGPAYRIPARPVVKPPVTRADAIARATDSAPPGPVSKPAVVRPVKQVKPSMGDVDDVIAKSREMLAKVPTSKKLAPPAPAPAAPAPKASFASGGRGLLKKLPGKMGAVGIGLGALAAAKDSMADKTGGDGSFNKNVASAAGKATGIGAAPKVSIADKMADGMGMKRMPPTLFGK